MGDSQKTYETMFSVPEVVSWGYNFGKGGQKVE